MSAFLEMLTSEAYRPHRADAAVPLGVRFAGDRLCVIGGGGTLYGWTQRVCFGKDGSPRIEGERTPNCLRASVEWSAHLRTEARRFSEWCVILVEQQWQAALGTGSVSGLDGDGVERMLRVRESTTEFGEQKVSEDAIRAAVDHPTMDGAVVIGVKATLVEQLSREARQAGFQIAAVRVPTFAILEQYLNRLHAEHAAPDRTLLVTDGRTALLVGIRGGAFDSTEGRFSYVVNRPQDWREAVWQRIAAVGRDERLRLLILGHEAAVDESLDRPGIEPEIQVHDPIAAALNLGVSHDLRVQLAPMRPALPTWSRWAVLGLGLVAWVAFGGAVTQLARGWALQTEIRRAAAELSECSSAKERADRKTVNLQKEAERDRRWASWLNINYHAQALTYELLRDLPAETTLQQLSLHAAEGLPQSQFRFVLAGSEEAQSAAIRSLERSLYRLGYAVARREEPTAANDRRGGIAYRWELIHPPFGRGGER